MINQNNLESQRLIDICFSLVSCALDHADYWKNKPIEEKMTWVSNQLRDCGFDTIPSGMSWGVLKK